MSARRGDGVESVNAAQVKEGVDVPRARAETKWVSRIHVRDICECVMASMERPCAGTVYNVADDEPAPRSVVMVHARQVCGTNTHLCIRRVRVSEPSREV
jgi:nucleoside-diphosphate-sugar epimerase